MYRAFIENKKIIRYILHQNGHIQRTMIWYDEGKRKSDWVIIAVDAFESEFEILVAEAEKKRKKI